MQATIEGIEQFMRLDGKLEMVSSVRIKLPDGTIFVASVGQDVIEKIIALSTGEEAQEPREMQELPDVSAGLAGGGVFGGDSETSQESQLVDWSELPDDVLAPAVKRALREHGFGHVMRASELASVVDEISERMLAKAQQTAKVQPPVQIVVPRARTVPKDDMGYPIVPHRQSDPGEVALTADEDGVQQA